MKRVRTDTVTMLLLALLLVLPCIAGRAEAREEIREYISEIIVHTDGGMTVTETITVKAEGNKIRRGIYRDFPTTYKDRHGHRVRVGFELLDVKRDGKSEPHHTEGRSNGVRVYIGQEDVTLPRGEYTYTLRYRTDRQLGFFDTYDELYWNVTGHGWDFPILKVVARVHLPGDAALLQHAAYTGFRGEQGDAWRMHRENGVVVFETTRSLMPAEGLTIAVAWPKGIVAEPTGREKMGYLVSDNAALLIAFAGFLLILLYYTVAWVRVGRDPEKGTIIPIYEPPAGLSASAMRFILRMGFDMKCFAAAVISLAVKGQATIEETKKKEFTLHSRHEANAPLTPGEEKVFEELFGAGYGSIKMEQKNHKTFQKAVKALRKTLKKEYEKVLFHVNSLYLFPGVLATLVMIVLVVIALSDSEQKAMTLFGSFWLAVWMPGLVVSLRKVGSSHGKARAGAVFASILSVVGALAGIGFLYWQVSLGVALFIPATLALLPVFHHLLKAPTLQGRNMMDRIEGFRLYLSVAEKDELKYADAPEKTPELYEQYLPYAIALGVEQPWSEKFAVVLARAAEERGYQPHWYRGVHLHSFAYTGFSDGMTSAFSSAISSASSAPGSSSGSGGGGSAGGGGGGGGGGGW